MNIDPTKDRKAQERPSDDFDGNVPIKLTKEELRNLSELSPSKQLSHRRRMDGDTDRVLLCQRHFNLRSTC